MNHTDPPLRVNSPRPVRTLLLWKKTTKKSAPILLRQKRKASTRDGRIKTRKCLDTHYSYKFPGLYFYFVSGP
jgi:hypothetical protein